MSLFGSSVSPVSSLDSVQRITPVPRTRGGAVEALQKHNEQTSQKNGELSGLEKALVEGRKTAAQKRIEDQYRLYKLMKGSAKDRIAAELQGIDSQVKSHEQAHMAVLGGAAASGINYNYVRGPDGRMYAVGGSIKVDLEPVPGNPEETIRKARQLRRAALAAGDPSSADMRVVAETYRMEHRAEQKLEKEPEAHPGRAADSTHNQGTTVQEFNPFTREEEEAVPRTVSPGGTHGPGTIVQGEEESDTTGFQRSGELPGFYAHHRNEDPGKRINILV